MTDPIVDRLTTKAVRVSRKVSRRSFISRATIVAAAAAGSPFAFALNPEKAMAVVTCSDCGSGSACCEGNSAFCCTLTGENSCPNGTVKSGWWRCSYNQCASGYRYFIDCNDNSCTCQCANGDCDRRKTCCNSQAYFQCNSNAGKVKCRIVRCTNPGSIWPGICNSTPVIVSSTCDETAGCLP
jgi:hypothetical protein